MKIPAKVNATEVLHDKIVRALEDPTYENIQLINRALFAHDSMFPDSLVRSETRAISKIIAKALQFNTESRRIEELKRANDKAYRLPYLVNGAIKQRGVEKS